jgi:3-methylcrotonyl-CoA carboxylase alpha subunit
MTRRTVTLERDQDERAYQVGVSAENGELRASAGGRELLVTRDGFGRVRVTSERTTTAWTVAAGDVRWVFVYGVVYELSIARPQARGRRGGHHGALSAPMPATVRRVAVKVNDAVKPGDALVILEAMKMELPIRAAAGGVVRAVHCREGELVQPGVTLVEIDEAPPPRP